jgi:FtsP/CotA-like multicopper oxidase with cupredoxin domain
MTFAKIRRFPRRALLLGSLVVALLAGGAGTAFAATSGGGGYPPKAEKSHCEVLTVTGSQTFGYGKKAETETVTGKALFCEQIKGKDGKRDELFAKWIGYPTASETEPAHQGYGQ